MPSLLSLYNQALDEVGAQNISSPDETNIEARSCKRAGAAVMAEFLEWHEWGAAIRRASLAELSANDRRDEWMYAYALPSNFATARRILPPASGQELSYPVSGPFTSPHFDKTPVHFMIDGATLYTNMKDAVLEYGVNELEPAQITALMGRAIALEIAARIAIPIKKSRELKGDLIKQAEVARTRAIADDENRYPRQQVAYVSDAEYARAGYGYHGTIALNMGWRD